MSDQDIIVEHHEDIIDGYRFVSTICIENFAWITGVVNQNGHNKFIYCCPLCTKAFDTTDEVKHHIKEYVVDGVCLYIDPVDSMVQIVKENAPLYSIRGQIDRDQNSPNDDSFDDDDDMEDEDDHHPQIIVEHVTLRESHCG